MVGRLLRSLAVFHQISVIISWFVIDPGQIWTLLVSGPGLRWPLCLPRHPPESRWSRLSPGLCFGNKVTSLSALLILFVISIIY